MNTFLMPYAGARHYSNYIGDTEIAGYYWSSSPEGTNNAYNLYVNTTRMLPQFANHRSYGFSVRCFKNTPPPSQTGSCIELPTNAERNTVNEITQTLSGSNWLPNLTGAYNETSSTSECVFKCSVGYTRDGNACVPSYPSCTAPDITIGNYTIQACNVGASVAGTGTASHGYYFQRGNNYGFSSTGSFSINPAPVDASAF
jgi:hypothetical protein